MMLTLFKFLLIAIGAVVAAGFVLRHMLALPRRRDVSAACHLPAPDDGPLAAAFGAAAARHPNASGVFSVADAADAFALRVLLARAATRSIDAQYYIWHRDLTGILLLKELRDAADRGVRVRILLDDNGTRGMDDLLRELHDHPNVEVRLFNPFALRAPKWLNYLLHFRRLNRRMHNKSLTVDNLATIVGGRNMGDSYFGTGANPLFIDLDILAAGAVVPQVSRDFDRYWNSAASYPVDLLVKGAPEGGILDRLYNEALRHPARERFDANLGDAAPMRRLLAGETELHWVPVKLVSDDPAKVTGKLGRDRLLFSKISDAMGRPQMTLDVISPYFVPGRAGCRAILGLREAGVVVRVMTNALEATDVPAVHAGYARYRRALLQAGIELYELKAAAIPPAAPEDRRRLGSSAASLHAKVLAVDGRSLYVGSLNFDPRSVFLNTELGFIIDDPRMAEQVHEGVGRNAPRLAYSPGIDGDRLVWRERTADGEEILHGDEPGGSLGRRLIVMALSRLPVEWLL